MGRVSIQLIAICALFNLLIVQAAFTEEKDKPQKLTEENDKPHQLKEVLVQAQKADLKETKGTAIGTYEQKKGTLTVPSNYEAAKIIERTAGGAAVVDSKAFDKNFSVNFQDTLSFVPGVFARKRFAEEVRISIRGSGLERNFHQKGLATFQDGIPFNAADSSGDFQEIDNLALQRIEVFKGGNGLQFGGTSLGGSINMISKTAHSQPGHLVRFEVGSDDTVRAVFQTGQFFNKSDLFISLSGLKSDEYRDHADQENVKFNSNLGIRLSQSTETRFYVSANYINQELPGTVPLAQALNSPRSASTNPFNNVITSDQHRDINSLRLANKTTFDLGGGHLLDVSVYAVAKDLFHPILPFVGVIDQQSINYGINIQGSGTYTVAGFMNQYRLGVTTQLGRTDAKVFANVGGRSGALTGDTDQDARNVVVFGENQFFITSKLALIFGAQFSWSYRKVEDQFTTFATNSQSFTSFNPRFGVLYQHSDTIQFFTNITKSFEPPDFSDLTQSGTAAFIPLNAQEAWTFEIGTRGQQGIFNWELIFYRAWVEDEILKFTVGAGIPATGFNADDTIHQGVEFGFGVILAQNLLSGGDELRWRNSYTYSDFNFDGDMQFGDNTIPGVPPHVYQTELRYTHRAHWFVAINADFVSEVDVDFTNTFAAPGYGIMGFAAGYDVNKNVSLFVTGRNVFNKAYISNFSTAVTATATSALFYAGDGSRYFGGVTVRF